MKKGDKFVVELEYRGDACAFSLVGANDVAFLYEDCVARAAATYAAKSAPAPVSTAWEPKPGDRVLVEAEVTRGGLSGNLIDDFEVTIPYMYAGNIDNAKHYVSRSAIVGPAPARARFAVGDEVLNIPLMLKCKIVSIEDSGSHGLGNIYHWKSSTSGAFGSTEEANLLTLDEARERLGKK